jgi:uncharacterized protein (TIRG00374 family)
MTKKNAKTTTIRGRYVLYAVLLVLMGAGIYRLRGDLSDAWQVAKHVSPLWLVLGVGLMLCSVACTSWVYHILSPKPLRYHRTLLVQTSSLFVNKVLPSGSGALGLSYLYLRTNRVDKISAASVVALNNIIGFLGHAALLLIVLVIDHNAVQIPDLNLPHVASWWIFAAGLLVASAAFALVMHRRKRPKNSPAKARLRRTLTTLKNPKRSGSALLTSMALTLCYVGCLWIAVAALGLHLSFPTLLIVLSVSVFATAVIPSPGGIGASEAGMFVALRAYGVDAGTALAVAMLYRTMTFWLPLILGAIAYVAVEKYKLISYKL